MAKYKIKAGMTIKYKGHTFEVVKYNGMFSGQKGKLKAIEMVSMFSNPQDFFLKDLPKKEQAKIKILE